MLKFQDKNRCFNFRAVAVLIKDNHVLIHKTPSDQFWSLPGGRVEFFEHAESTVTRELKEELGLKSKVNRPLWIVENFFQYHDDKYHEIAHYFLIELLDNIKPNFKEIIKGIESDQNLIFKWINLNDLISNNHNSNLKPDFLNSALLNIPTELKYLKINELSK